MGLAPDSRISFSLNYNKIMYRHEFITALGLNNLGGGGFAWL